MKTLLFLLPILCLCSTAYADEKLLVGFEPSEMEQKQGGTLGGARGVDKCLISNKNSEGFDFFAPFESPAVTSMAWAWPIRMGDATQEQHALCQNLTEIGTIGEEGSTFERTPYWSFYYPTLRKQTTPEAEMVMNTFIWLINNPALRDWSGYDRLLIDVKVDSDMKIQVALEDEMIAPPVMRAFDVPSNTWCCLEIDLKQAVQQRGIDLERIANFWMLGLRNGTVKVDNIRLGRGDELPSLPLLRDASSMALPEPPQKFQMPELPAEPNRREVTLERPAAVCPGSVTPFGFIGAFDNDHIVIGYNKGVYGGNTGSRGGAYVRFTADGGKTWSEEKRIGTGLHNLDHGSGRGNVIDSRGNASFITSSAGCAGIGSPTSRQHFYKIDFNGDGWDDPPQLATSILDGDSRHCAHSTTFVIRQRYGANQGRLWCSWGQHGRLHGPEVVVSYSDDDGKTWFYPVLGKGPIPGSRFPTWTDDTYRMPETAITQYGEHVAVFWEDDRGLLWSTFNGVCWSDVKQVHSHGQLPLARGYSLSAVTVGMNEIFVTSSRTAGVMHLEVDGTTWRNELESAGGGGALTVCGSAENPNDDQVMYVTAGLGGPAPVLCYRRKHDGAWEAPLNLSAGNATIQEYRRWVSLVVPPYSPPNFAPVAWNQINQVRMVKVPTLNFAR